MNRWQMLEAMDLQDIRPPVLNEPPLLPLGSQFGSIAVSRRVWDEKIRGPKKPPRTDYSAVISLASHFSTIVFAALSETERGEGKHQFKVTRYVPDIERDETILSWKIERWDCVAIMEPVEFEGELVSCLTFYLADERA